MRQADGDRDAPGGGVEHGVLEGLGVAGGLDDDGGLEVLGEGLVRSQGLGGSEAAGLGELGRIGVDGDHLAGFLGRGRQYGGHPDSAQADHDDVVARLRASGVDDRPASGEHGAAENCGDLARELVGNRHDGLAVDDGVVGESGDAEMVQDRPTVAMQSDAASQEGPRRVGLGAWNTRKLAVGEASGAGAASGQEGERDVLPDLQVVDAGSELLHDAGGLVAQEHGDGTGAGPVEHRKVGMADSGRRDAHQDLVLLGAVQFERADADRGAGRVGGLAPDLFENRSCDLHD
jgi:hypothetical protein